MKTSATPRQRTRPQRPTRLTRKPNPKSDRRRIAMLRKKIQSTTVVTGLVASLLLACCGVIGAEPESSTETSFTSAPKPSAKSVVPDPKQSGGEADSVVQV